MQLPDTNIWLALSLSKHVFHQAARSWFAAQSAKGSVLFCRGTQQSLLRLLTTAKFMQLYDLPAMTNAEAWNLYEAFLRDTRVARAAEPHSLEVHWKAFSTRNTASSKLWMDAYLAAFAVGCGAKLVTTDQGFLQFANLNPHILSLEGEPDLGRH